MTCAGRKGKEKRQERDFSDWGERMREMKRREIALGNKMLQGEGGKDELFEGKRTERKKVKRGRKRRGMST